MAELGQGFKYQLSLTAYLASHLSKNQKVRDYHVFYEREEVAPFDDIVLAVDYIDSKDLHLYLIQAKSGRDKLDISKYIKGYINITLKKPWKFLGNAGTIREENIHFWYITSKKLPHNTVSFNDDTLAIDLDIKEHQCDSNVPIISKNVYKLFTKNETATMKYQGFFDKFYIFQKQPDTKTLMCILKGMWALNSGQIIEYLDTYFTKTKGGLCKRIFELQLLKIRLFNYIVMPTRAFQMKSESVHVWNEILLLYNATIIESELNIEKYLFGCILQKLNNIINIDEWNACVDNEGKLSNDVKARIQTKLSKPETLKELIIHFWICGEIPLILQTNDSLPMLQEFSHLNQKYLIIDSDPAKRSNEMKNYNLSVLKDLGEIKSHRLLQLIVVSMQGRKPVSLSTITKNNCKLLEAVSCSTVIKLIKPRQSYLRENSLKGSDYMLFIIETIDAEVRYCENYNSVGDNKIIYCQPNESSELCRTIKNDPQFKSYKMYRLLLKDGNLSLLEDDAHRYDLNEEHHGLESFFIDQDGESVFDIDGHDPIPIIGETINCSRLRYIPRYLREGYISKKQIEESNAELTMNVEYTGLRFAEEDFFKEMTSKIIILTGDAGFGKTSLLQSLFWNCEPHYYVLFRDLAHYKVNVRDMKNVSKEFLCKNNEPLSYGRFVTALQADEKRLLLILDSFDEVIATRRQEILELIERLNEEVCIGKIIIASRLLATHFLIEKFEAQIFKIQSLNDEDVVTYMRYWNISNINLQKMPVEFSENPLYLNMLRTISEKAQITDITTKRTLYESIIQLKLEDCCRRINPYGLCESEKENILEYHQLLALKAILGSNNITRKLQRKRRDTFPNFIRLGMITCYDENGSPVFVHHSFADFFVIQWLIENIDEDEAKYIYNELLTNKKIYILDMYCEHSPLYRAIQVGNLRRVRKLVKKYEYNLTEKDLVGRTLLHFAVIMFCDNDFGYDATDILSIVIQNTPQASLDVQDILNWNWVNYYNMTYGTKKFLFGFRNTIIREAYLNYYMSNVECECPVFANKPLFNTIYDMVINTSSISFIGKLLFLKYCKRQDFQQFYSDNQQSSIMDLFKHFEPNEEKLTPLHVACIYSKFDVVMACIEDSMEINASDIFNCTPLHYSVQGNQSLEVVKLLLENGAKLDIKAGEDLTTTVLHMSVRAGNITVTEMLLQKIDVNERDRIKSTALHYAAESGYLQMVELLLDNGAYVNSKNARNFTPLSVAGEKHHKDIIRLLLEHQASVRDVNLITQGHEESILNVAVIDEDMDIIKILLDHQADVNVITSYNTPFTNAVRTGNEEIIRMLLKFDADINLENRGCYTPLTIAIEAEKENVEIVKLLLESGASVNCADKDGFTPLDCAVRKGYTNLVRILLDNQADLNMKISDCSTPLFSAIKGNHVDIVEILLNRGASVASVDKYGFTPLMDAAEVGNPKVGKLLLKNNADLNFKNDYGVTPLYVAAFMQNEDFVKFLIDHGADTNIITSLQELFNNAKNRENIDVINWILRTHLTRYDTFKLSEEIDVIEAVIKGKDINLINELNLAIRDKNLQIIETLFEWNVDINFPDTSGITPLNLAIQLNDKDIDKIFLKAVETPLYFDNVVTSENLDMIKLLLRSGADFTEFHDYGLQILLSAIEYEKEDIVRESLNDQAVIDLINNANTKPLILAIYKEKIEIINILVSKIDVNIVNKSGITALMAAAEIGNIIIAQTLLENNADINYVNEYGITALYIAALTGNEKLVEMLLHSGARENVEISGNAILFRAVEARNITAIKLLMMEPSTSNTNLDIIRNVMSNRANINCVNDNGRTPLHVAISLKYLDVIRTLLAYGPDAHQADKHGFTPLDMIVQICKEVIEKMRCSSIVSRDDIRLGLIIKELHSKTNSFEEKRIIAETLDLIFDR